MVDTNKRRAARAAQVAQQELRDLANELEARWRAESYDQYLADQAEDEARAQRAVHIHVDAVVVVTH